MHREQAGGVGGGGGIERRVRLSARGAKERDKNPAVANGRKSLNPEREKNRQRRRVGVFVYRARARRRARICFCGSISISIGQRHHQHQQRQRQQQQRQRQRVPAASVPTATSAATATTTADRLCCLSAAAPPLRPEESDNVTRDKRGGGRGFIGGTMRTKGEEEGTSRGDRQTEREREREGEGVEKRRAKGRKRLSAVPRF